MPALILQAQGLTVNFQSVRALSNVSLEVPTGALVGLIGPNGAGKSTALAVLGGQLRPSGGRVFLDGHDITSESATRRARRGLRRTFQHLELYDDLTLAENLMTSLVATRNASGRRMRSLGIHEARHEAMDELVSLGLERYADAPCLNLPQAVRRLAAYARAVMGGSRVLLLDEPAAGLSESERGLLGDRLVADIRSRRLTVVLVEHDMGIVQRLCDHVYVLNAGEVIASGTYAEIAASSTVQRAYLG